MKVLISGIEVELNRSEEESDYDKLKYTVDDMVMYCCETRRFIEEFLQVAVVSNQIKQEKDGKLTMTLLLDHNLPLLKIRSNNN